MGPQTDAENAILGPWSFVDYRTDLLEGDTSHPMGQDRRGIIIYAPNGYMAVQLIPATTKKVKSTIHDILAYTGRYWIEAQPDGGMMVIHRMDMCSEPHLEGSTQQRILTISGSQTRLASPVFMPLEVIGPIRVSHSTNPGF